MRLSIVIAVLLILFAGTASAATVTMSNGDTVSGKILPSEGRMLLVQNAILGIVRVPLTAVTDIQSDSAFTVVLGTGDSVTGVLTTDGAGNVAIESESGAVSTPLADINRMMPAPMGLAYPGAEEPKDDVDAAIEQAAPSEWNAEAELGFNWQTGNTERLGLVIGFKLDREDENSKTGIRFGLIYTEDDKERSANSQLLAGQHDIKIDEKWYFFGLVALSRDEFKDIDFRGALTPGIGYIFHNDASWKLRAEVGPTLTYTAWDDDSPNDNEWTFDVYVAVKGEVAVFDEARLIQNFFWYPSITNSPDGRFISETVFEQPLSEKLFLRITFIVNYDTTVTAPTKETDTNLLVTLAIKF